MIVFWFGRYGSSSSPNGVLPYCHRVRRPTSLLSFLSLSPFVMKWGSRISQERFDSESPYFTRIFIPVGSTTVTDTTSLCTSGRKLSTFENGRKWRLGRLQLESKKLAHIHTEILINYAGYDVTDYLRLAVTEVKKKQSKMPHPTALLLYISRTDWARFTKVYEHIHADLSYIDTGYDITSCFRSEATATKPSKIPPQAAGFRWNFSRTA